MSDKPKPPPHPRSPARASLKPKAQTPPAETTTTVAPYAPAASAQKSKNVPTVKAYKNQEFLNSSQARLLRVNCEYEETMQRLKRFKIKATVLVFGSARARSREDYLADVEAAQTLFDNAAEGPAKEAAGKALARVKKTEWMGEMTEKIVELARLVTAWGVSPDCALGKDAVISGVTRYHYTDPNYANHPWTLGANRPSWGILGDADEPVEQGVYICTGGGPGFMNAANKGAAQVPGAKNIGMCITLPFEDGANEHVTPELAFEFHYFFTRKFWMVYHCQALVVAPGGFGTMDELFEVLTLKQTGKIQKTLPVVLFGKVFWQTVINWQALVDLGTISQDDVDTLFFTDDAQEAADYLITSLSRNNNAQSERHAGTIGNNSWHTRDSL